MMRSNNCGHLNIAYPDNDPPVCIDCCEYLTMLNLPKVKYDGKSAVILEVLATQYFVEFEDGSRTFVFIAECKEEGTKKEILARNNQLRGEAMKRIYSGGRL